ncbi:outer membrane protein [Methylocapsa acidiphila]|uniref:outer membrane protein n=1 Tax=Methylocapsa acidiphila TaxID=133552 RepID=UPI000414FD34|nr:outer membrane protein [Methylocapsa acidiphila]
MIRRLLLATVSAAMTASSALAADLPSPAPPPGYVPPQFTWTGVYVGGQIGWGQGNNNGSIGYGPHYASYGYESHGVIGGAHIGYNLQIKQFVVGLEGSVDGLNLNRSLSTNVGLLPVYYSQSSRVQGSIRGRLGVVGSERWLLYATGGAAFASINASLASPFSYDGKSNTRVGWTLGGGLEYARTSNWSARVEYRYSDFSGQTFHPTVLSAAAAPGAFVNRRFTENQIQAGFSYKFDLVAPASVVAKY